MKNQITSKRSPAKKRMLIYARVSTEEQTKGNYPSCDSQVEELEDECIRQGWDIYRVVKDEGISAGSLKRPGLTEVRFMVQANEIDGILCTWYDRLTRSRDFYILDHEFQSHNVEFITLHDAADTRTAAGRFMESMIVAAKTYDRDQTSEKVRTKMRMRLEKGLHQGGLVPFGFLCDKETKLLSPDPDKQPILEQIFRTYVETRSDFAVRDWLKAHSVPTPRGKGSWQVSTLRDLLSNRRYIGEIEINRKSKNLDVAIGDVREVDAHRIVKAPHEPLIPIELFEMVQAIRKEKSVESKHRIGRPRSYSVSRCGRVNSLQSVLFCSVCGHSMAPHYSCKRNKSDEGSAMRYNHYYVCAPQVKGNQEVIHKNRISAPTAEKWAWETVQELIQSEGVIERAVEKAKERSIKDFAPERELLTKTHLSLQENKAKIEQLTDAFASGKINESLLDILNEKALVLKMDRETLRIEQRKLEDKLRPLEQNFDESVFRQSLRSGWKLSENATPDEQQQLLRLLVKKVEWSPTGRHTAQFYYIPTLKRGDDEFATVVRSGGLGRFGVEPVFLRLFYYSNNALSLASPLIQRF